MTFNDKNNEFPSVNPNTIETHLRIVWIDGYVYEIRALCRSATYVSYWKAEDRSIAAAAVVAFDAAKNPYGIYTTINPVDSALLRRPGSCRQFTMAGNRGTTSDSQIVRRLGLVIDLDPRRESGTSSTDAEHDAARDRAETIRQDLLSVGWPEPMAIGSSGNGIHLVYGIDAAPHSDRVKQTLRGLAARHSDATIEVDVKMHNASRITKLFGTIARKGESTVERPHRLACLLETPGGGSVTVEMLATVAAWQPEKARAAAPPVAAVARSTPSGDDFYTALATLDQRHVLTCISGTWLVSGERFDFRQGSDGKFALIVDDRATSNWIDAAGKIGAADTGKRDSGPLASTWCRHYGHSNADIRRGLIEFVPELARFAAKTSATATVVGSRETEPDGDLRLDPEPLRRSIPPAAPFPLDALGPILGAAASSIHSTVKAPASLCASSVLAAASLATQPHGNVVLRGTGMPLTLWMVTVAKSGDRKSTTDDLALAEHIAYEKELEQKHSVDYQAYLVALEAWETAKTSAKAIGKKGTNADVLAALTACGPEPLPPPSAILTFQDPTVEAIQKLYLAGSSSLGLFANDAATFFGSYSMAKDHKIHTIGSFVKFWDDGSSDRVRAGDGAKKIRHRRLAMHVMMQPVLAESILGDPQLAGHGFLARMLMVAPDSLAGYRTYEDSDPATAGAVVTYHERMRELLRRPAPVKEGTRGELSPRDLTLTPQAKARWIDVYNEFETGQRPGSRYYQIQAWASRGAEQVARIAGVLTLVESPDAVEVAEIMIERAAKLVRYYLGEVIRQFDSTASIEVRHAEAILDWCKERDLLLVSSTTLVQYGPHAVREAKAITTAMELLVKHGWAVAHHNILVDGKKVRRAWRFHPAILASARPDSPASDLLPASPHEPAERDELAELAELAARVDSDEPEDPEDPDDDDGVVF